MVDYSISVVTYLDILGFKKLIEDKSADEVLQTLDKFRQALEPLPEFFDLVPNLKTLRFSDLAIRINDFQAVEGGIDNPIEYSTTVAAEIIALSKIQLRLIETGQIIRGGITTGNIYISDDNAEPSAFGPAFVEAYELESKHAIFPRIVVQPGLRESILKSVRTYGEEYLEGFMKIIDPYLHFDFDGIWHVDYLGALIVSGFDIDRILDAHRGIITIGLDDFPPLSKEARKYSWLAQYHNSYLNSLKVDELNAHQIDKDALLVPINDQINDYGPDIEQRRANFEDEED